MIHYVNDICRGLREPLAFGEPKIRHEKEVYWEVYPRVSICIVKGAGGDPNDNDRELVGYAFHVDDNDKEMQGWLTSARAYVDSLEKIQK